MAIDIRGLLIHVTHYDPAWVAVKDFEPPFDLGVAMELLPLMASCGMNLLVVDVEDGVEYKSHPEMRRHYSVPISQMKTLADAARSHGIDVVPKVNFSKSGRNLHDKWLAPHWDHVSWLKNTEDYFRVGRDVIAELTDTMRPKKFIHIGMDEDHYRSHEQYVETIERLRGIVKELGLRTIIWNDSCHFRAKSIAQVHAEKSRTAEERISKDIVHVLWDYGGTHPDIVKRIASRGFEVWGAPGGEGEQIASWSRALDENGGTGLLMTNWIKCSKFNRNQLIEFVSNVGPEVHGR
jgi:hypothetical protein